MAVIQVEARAERVPMDVELLVQGIPHRGHFFVEEKSKLGH